MRPSDSSDPAWFTELSQLLTHLNKSIAWKVFNFFKNFRANLPIRFVVYFLKTFSYCRLTLKSKLKNPMSNSQCTRSMHTSDAVRRSAIRSQRMPHKESSPFATSGTPLADFRCITAGMLQFGKQKKTIRWEGAFIYVSLCFQFSHTEKFGQTKEFLSV